MNATRAPIVVLRELTRASKRFWGRGVRMIVVTPFAVTLAVALMFHRVVSDSLFDITKFGSGLFIAMSLLVLLCVGLLVPAQVGQVVAQERDERTLELLAMTGIRPGRVLFELVAGRVLQTAALVLGVVPLMGLGLTLGGVHPSQIAALCVVSAALAAVLTGLTVFVGVLIRGVLVPLLVAIVWAILFLGVLPLRFVLLLSPSRFVSPEWFFPYVSIFDPVSGGQPWSRSVVVTVLPWCVLGAVSLVLAGWRFRHMVATGWQPTGQTMPVSRWVIVAGLGSFVALWIGAEVGLFISLGLVPGVSIYVCTWLLGNFLFLAFLSWLLPRVDRPRARVTRYRSWSMVAFGPMLWKDLVTRAAGGIGRLSGWVVAGWTVVWLSLIVYRVFVDQRTTSDMFYLWNFLGLWGGAFLMAATAASSFVDERARRALSLLSLSKVSTVHVLVAKVASSFIRFSPMVILASLTWSLTISYTAARWDVPVGVMVQVAWLLIWFPLVSVVALFGAVGLSAILPRTMARIGPVVAFVLALPSFLCALVLLQTLLDDVFRWNTGRMIEMIFVPRVISYEFQPSILALSVAVWTTLLVGVCVCAWWAVRFRMRVGEPNG